MVALYAVTIFVSAGLLFLVQPMFARMVLPLLGGSPAVWNTAMVFYQAVLLAGYAYAHASTTRFGARRQAVVHVLLLLLPLAFLPIALPAGWTPPTEGNPVPWLLGLMTVAVGLAFFAVSTTSPVLQRWFAATEHPRAADPYFLYVASNAGSLLALLSYPLWVERQWILPDQSRGWMWGYWLLVALTAGCAVTLWRNAPRAAAGGADALLEKAVAPTGGRRARWVLLAFVPSSLLLGVTTYLSSEIAAVPLIWVIPLSLYLVTFIVAFARRTWLPVPWLRRALPIVLVPLVLALVLRATQPIGPLMLLHLGAFFVASLLCHARLAEDRPEAAFLTEFYLCLSLGGVLGGVFNALVAPVVFDTVVEYPAMLVLAAAVGLGAGVTVKRIQRGDWLWPLALGVATWAASEGVERVRGGAGLLLVGAVFGGLALVCYLWSQRPVRFALGLAALLGGGSVYQGGRGQVLHTERGFFGVHRVMRDAAGPFHLLVHGSTLHGRQSLDPARRREPLTYYHRTGPIGQVLQELGRGPGKTVAAVGLGAGSLASYAEAGQSWTFFEIDPIVLQLARDPRYFTFLREATVEVPVKLGDARLSLAAEADGAFDLMIMDAYSSDAIPVHLVTREALALYLRKLAPGGAIAFHISNLHLDLEPVFGNLARDAGLSAWTRDDTTVTDEEEALGKSPSVWLVMARRTEDLAPLAADGRWQPSRTNERQPVWTDSYSSLWSVFRWR